VNDSRDEADTLALLVGLWGHEPLVADSASAALAVALGGRPDVILLDITSPRMAHAAEAAGGPHAVAFGKVLGDLGGLVLGQVTAEERGAGALGEVPAACGAAQAADVLGLAGPAVRADVVAAPLAEGGPVALFQGALPVTSDTPTA
jgi:hypothetical protein